MTLTKIPSEIRASLVHDLRIESLPEDLQEDFIERFYELVFEAVLTRAVAEVDDEHVERVVRLVEEASSIGAEKLIGELQTMIPHIHDFFIEEELRLREKIHRTESIDE